MKRIVTREMPDGSVRLVHPFHISLEGMESVVLCRDEEDYDVMVKTIAVSAWRKNVIVVIYVVVSNHCHVAVLSDRMESASACGDEIKRIYSMWFNRKYGESGVMKGTDVKTVLMEDNRHVRNALAYIPRNALDNGCDVNTYKWSGYGAMFRKEAPDMGVCLVRSLNKREKRDIMHTHDDLSRVPWTLDEEDMLVPSSFCDRAYLEQCFEGDQTFFIRTIGTLSSAEVKDELISQPRRMMNDSEMVKVVNDVSRRWFQVEVTDLPKAKKYRLVTYLYRSRRTTVNQLARVLALEREEVAAALR